MAAIKRNLSYLLSKRTSSELLSSWLTCTTSGQGFSARKHTQTQHYQQQKQESQGWQFISWACVCGPWFTKVFMMSVTMQLSAYPGRCWWTRTCWSWGSCILHWLAGWGRSPETHRYTPVGTPAGEPQPSQTHAEGWAGGSRNAACMEEEICKSRVQSALTVCGYLAVVSHLKRAANKATIQPQHDV